MKLRHAAALPLVGWYLMTPPMDAQHNVRSDLPLGQWAITLSFDSAKECEAERSREFDHSLKDLTDPANMSTDQLIRDGWKVELQRKCVATDDPRLKGN